MINEEVRKLKSLDLKEINERVEKMKNQKIEKLRINYNKRKEHIKQIN